MRASLMLLPLIALATPAATAEPAVEVPKELTDPAMIDRLGEVMKALSSAFLDMPIGQVQAAVEGRPVTDADRKRTVRSEAKVGERELAQHIDAAKPAMQAGMKAMAAAIPAMVKAMEPMAEELEKATANVPQPGYPKR